MLLNPDIIPSLLLVVAMFARFPRSPLPSSPPPPKKKEGKPKLGCLLPPLAKSLSLHPILKKTQLKMSWLGRLLRNLN